MADKVSQPKEQTRTCHTFNMGTINEQASGTLCESKRTMSLLLSICIASMFYLIYLRTGATYHDLEVSSDHTAPSGVPIAVIEVGGDLVRTLGRGGLGDRGGDIEERVHCDEGGANWSGGLQLRNAKGSEDVLELTVSLQI